MTKQPGKSSHRFISEGVNKRKLLLPDAVLEVVGLHECQTVAIEHEADVDEEDTVTWAPIEELLFEQLTDATLVRPVTDAVVTGNILIQLDFVRAGVRRISL